MIIPIFQPNIIASRNVSLTKITSYFRKLRYLDINEIAEFGYSFGYKDKDLNLKIPPIWETQTAQGVK